ncbi:rhomboid family intramembrane serine protease [Niabella sp. CJ426]|uniref:rhomboid family intramembrane serine protease n=1 Tax=Niabella sp. CJ426 TaxID=3393740 RepID=UPI003D072712
MMTESIPPYTEERVLGILTKDQFLSLAREAANRSGLTIGYTDANGFTSYTNNGAFSWNGELSVKVSGEVAQVSSSSTAYEAAHPGKNKELVLAFLAQLDAQPHSDTGEVQRPGAQVTGEEDEVASHEAPAKSQSLKNLLSLFVPVPGFFVTPILINLNILVFIAMVATGVHVLTPDGESLVRWGANFKPVTLEGQWWRLLTNCFLHIGILHLLLNMYALVYIGQLLEPYLGKARFLTAYLLAGIAASVTSLWWHDLTISAGASGAIFGMYGVFLAMLTSDLIEREARKSLLASISIFVGYNLLYGLKGGIDNAAHIGGLVSGFIIGYGFLPGLRDPEESPSPWKAIALTSLVVLGVSFGVYKNLPNDLVIYEKGIKEFTDTEAFALSVFKLPEDTPKKEKLFSLRDEGLNYWNQNLALVKSFEQLKLPEHLVKRNGLLKEYCELRIKSFELMYRAVAEESPRFDEEIASVNQKIEAVIEKLGDEG